MIRRICIVSILWYAESTTTALSTPYGQTTRNIATQILQGAGPAIVDLNKYNLPLDQIEGEWTAQAVQKTTEQAAGIFLRPKDDRNNFVDVLPIGFPRVEGQGLGIELKELAGGRKDGIGITLVTSLVPGGAAQDSGILYGDSIAEVSIVRTQIKTAATVGLEETQQIFAVKTECLSYDATVQAIQSLPPIQPGFEDSFRLTIKRLRKKPKVKVNLQYPPEQKEPDVQIEMFAGENLRQGMLIRGVKLNDPLAKRFDTKSGGNCGAGGLVSNVCRLHHGRRGSIKSATNGGNANVARHPAMEARLQSDCGIRNEGRGNDRQGQSSSMVVLKKKRKHLSTLG